MLEVIYDQTQVRSKPFTIKFKCYWRARQSLLDSFCFSSALDARNALESAFDKTQMGSTIYLRSKHSWSKISLACSRLWSELVALEVIHDHIQARSAVSLRSKWGQISLRSNTTALESTYD